MTSTEIKKDFYMPGLDGLRALAVFAVIAYHLSLPFAPGGFLGVTLFFVLSGYLITDILLAGWTRDHKISLKSFFIRRGKRLLPSVFFLLICLSAYVTIFRPDLLANLKSAILPAMFYFSNWWYIFQKMPYFGSFGTPSLLTHFWSLAVEVQFYFLWPFLLFLMQRLIKRKWIKVTITAVAAVLSAVLMAVLYQPGTDPSRIYYGTDTRVFSLLLGACLAFIYPSMKIAELMQKKTIRVISDVAGFITLFAVLFMTYYITQYDDFLYWGGMLLFSFASLLLIAAAANPSTIIGRIFSFKPLRFIGKISYGVYLWQFPVIVITNSMFPSNKVSIALSVLQVAATILFATLSYYLIEKPIRQTNIIKSLKKASIGEFFRSFLHTRWWEKTAVLLVVTLVLVSGIGFINAQAVPASTSDELSALPSQMYIAPPDQSGTSADPAASPSADASASPVSPGISTDNPAESTGTPTSDPASGTPSPASPSGDPANVTPSSDVSPSGSADPSSTPQSEASSEITPSDLRVTVIGDSVAIDIAPYLQAYYPRMNVDAEVGRQFYQAAGVVKKLIEKNELGSTVVIVLGSNGSFKDSQMHKVIEQIGSERKIVFVNSQVPRSWCETVNSTLAKISAEYTNTIVADWYSASIGKDDYFYNDDVHPNKTGSPVMAKLIADTISIIQPYKPYIAVY